MDNELHDRTRTHKSSVTEDPPTNLMGTLTRIGPGLIIAGSIVGSGELINTTKAGAEAGFWLLWLIIIGCVIKVFTQVEIGRFTVAWSQTPLRAFNEVPGPRWRANWIVWFWALVMVTVITQQGGIVGGVGQALTISFPLTERGLEHNDLQDQWVEQQVELGELFKRFPVLQETPVNITRILDLRLAASGETSHDEDSRRTARAALDRLLEVRRETIGAEHAEAFESLEQRVIALKQKLRDLGQEPYDAYLWATILGVITSIMLYVGRYGLIQMVSTVFVGLFTVLTVITLIMLQSRPEWAVSGADLGLGLSFRLPPSFEGAGRDPIFTALAAFGIIGVGATELVMYPYWCIEKGYARHTGPRDGTAAWDERARGWMRVMRVDAWLSMVVYTFATVAFYLLGAAVLGRTGLNPGGQDLIRTLAEVYVPVFGDKAQPVFLFGAFAVLYSTFFVAAAGNARTVADALGIFGFTDGTEQTRMRWTKILSAVWPMIAVALFWIVGWFGGGQQPALMVMAAGIGGALLLPIIGVGALWFRFRRCVDALRPGRLWDVMLWISFLGFLIAGAWSFYVTVEKFL
ncbi:MAG: divalent metal cation transporter [Pirellulales bacterium]|nr:divalent metal cation transporter [Pirellulales bacterium]